MSTVPPVLLTPRVGRVSHWKRNLFIIAGVALVIIVSGGFWFFRKHDPPVIVQTDKVARRNLTEIVVANGKIQPVTEVTISPEVSGEIIELPVKEGQQVTNGQFLIKINPDIYIAALNSANANYEAALASAASGVLK